jgi:NitT/TauT family transport system substrate-binding protein
MSTRREFLQAAVGGVVAYGTLGRGTPVAAQVPFKIGTVVLGDFSTVAPVLVAQEKGFFKTNGIAAEWIPFKGGPDLLKGVLSGSVEMGITGATDPLTFRERGTTIRALATVCEKNHFVLVVAPSVKRLEDLKGSTIGVTAPGATTWIFARLIARKMNWDPEREVRILGVGGFDAQVAGMRRGELQAFIWGDGGAVAESEGVGRILMRLDEVTPRWISEVAYATDETIKARKDVLAGVLKSLFQGIKFCRENADESIRIGAKGIGWSDAATRRAYELVRPLLSTDGRIDVDALKLMQDTLLELGVLKQRLPLDQHYTTEFTPIQV